MPLVSRNIVLDEYIEDKNFILLLGEDEKPFYCILNEIDPVKNKKKSIIMGAFRSGEKKFIYKRISGLNNKGRINIKEYPSIEKCVLEYKKEFKKLTENTWQGRFDFKIRNNTILFSLGEPAEPEKDKKVEEISLDLNLNWRVKELLTLIGSLENIKVALEDINIDGTVTGICEKEGGGIYIPPKNISDAKTLLYKYFIDISEGKEVDSSKITRIYYSLIPILKEKIEIINTEDDIVKKLEDLETLDNISFTISMLKKETKGSKETVRDESGELYRRLNYNMTEAPLKEWLMISEYFEKSKGSTHNFNLKLSHVIKLENKQLESRYLQKYGSERRELLYHGSKVVNWVSILKRGLLLDPSKVASNINGKLFGNGIYWANSVSKSSQYCGSLGYQKRGGKEQIVLALADVALGRVEKKTTGGNCDRSKYDTVEGIGKYSYSKYQEISPNLFIPDGNLEVLNTNTYLHYDEKIIYEQDRYLFKYILVCEYN